MKAFVRSLDEGRIVRAIRAAEARTSGEIRVFVTRRNPRGGDTAAEARREFERLKMSETRERNGILFYVAPRGRKLAVVGDENVHAHCGQEFWDAAARSVEAAFRGGDFTGGLVAGIEMAGDLLAKYFPRSADDRDELPDTVAGD